MAVGRNSARNKNNKPGAVSKGVENVDLMLIPEYIDKSLLLVSEALKKGFDVLQLENGDIVTSGVKTIVITYRWNGKTGKMTKLSTQETINTAGPILAPLKALAGKKSFETKTKKPAGKRKA